MCLPWAACPRGRESIMEYWGAMPPASIPGLGYNQDPQSGCLRTLVLACSREPFPGQAQLGPTAEQGLSSAQRGVVCSEACPKYLGKNKKGGNQGSIQLAASVLAHRSSHCSRRGVVHSSQAMLGTWSPSVSLQLTPLSPTAPRAPGTPSPTTDGTTSRTPGTTHVAPPAAPPVPARRRAGLPRPPPSPPPPLPTAPGTLSSGGRPGQPVFLPRGVGGHTQPPPRLQPWEEQPGRLAGCTPLPPPVCPRRRSRLLRHPGFIPQCLLAPCFIT